MGGRHTGEGRADLGGLRVLVPRGGPWGDRAAAEVRRAGGEPVVAPLVDFAAPDDPAPLAAAVEDLATGRFDWLVVTSATTADVLARAGVRVPGTTRVAAVGPATAAACRGAGFEVALELPSSASSAQALAAAWPAAAGRAPLDRAADGPPGDLAAGVLLPQSDLADDRLARDLAGRGADVCAVVAYRTVGVTVDPAVRADVAAGRVGAILVTSGSVARQVAAQLVPLPATVLVACLGPRTADEAAAAGLHVALVAPERSVAALVRALADAVMAHRPPTQ